MKKIFLAIFCFICFGVINSLSAQEANNTSAIGTDYKTAIGIRLSNNAPIVGNAITLKHFLNDKTAIEGFFHLMILYRSELCLKYINHSVPLA